MGKQKYNICCTKSLTKSNECLYFRKCMKSGILYFEDLPLTNGNIKFASIKNIQNNPENLVEVFK